MDNDLLKAIAGGLAASATTLGAAAAFIPKLFKGTLRHERELIEQGKNSEKELAALRHETEERMRLKNERHIEVVTIKDGEIERLQDALQDVQRELKDQYAINTELTRQVFTQIQFLQSLAGLAAKDRRGSAAGG